MLDKILAFIATKLTTKVGSFTFASGVTGSASNVRIAQVGNVVSLQLNITVTQDLGTGEVILGTIGGVDKPKTLVREAFMSWSNLYGNGEMVYGGINTNGQVFINLKTGTHRAFRGNITYIV